jgi:hypothetical protein
MPISLARTFNTDETSTRVSAKLSLCLRLVDGSISYSDYKGCKLISRNGEL